MRLDPGALKQYKDLLSGLIDEVRVLRGARCKQRCGDALAFL